jgi:hypothetical protein
MPTVPISAHGREWRSSRPGELDALLTTVITRITHTLVRAGVLVAEDEQPYLDLAMDSPYEQLAGAAMRYVIAAGPQAGRAKAHLVRYHGLFTPNARERGSIVARPDAAFKASDECASNAGSTPMSWMARLKRVFAVDLSRFLIVVANCE